MQPLKHALISCSVRTECDPLPWLVEYSIRVFDVNLGLSHSGYAFLQTNENMEVTSALQSEQHVKKELAKKIGQLQEKLAELKETVCAGCLGSRVLPHQCVI